MTKITTFFATPLFLCFFALIPLMRCFESFCTRRSSFTTSYFWVSQLKHICRSHQIPQLILHLQIQIRYLHWQSLPKFQLNVMTSILSVKLFVKLFCKSREEYHT